MEKMMNNKIDVVKFGSNLVTDTDNGLNTTAINKYVSGLCEQYQDGLIVVTSGAVATGRARARELYGVEEAQELSDKMCAGLGATAVFNAWETAFLEQRRGASSYPITHHQLNDISAGSSDTNFVEMLLENAKQGIVSIINEADALSDIELMLLACGGDNDGLAAHVARAVGARSLTLFTKKGGIFDDSGNLISRVDKININKVRDIAQKRQSSSMGRGGLITKVNAARESAGAGIYTRIAGINKDMSGKDATEFVVG